MKFHKFCMKFSKKRSSDRSSISFYFLFTISYYLRPWKVPNFPDPLPM